MPRFAANLSMMFNESPFLERFDRAADAGFEAVEFLFPYDFAPDDIARALERNKLTQALFNLPPGDWDKGERGMACRPEAFEAVMAGVERALPYVRATGVKRLHLMSGHGDHKDPKTAAAYERAVRAVAERLAREDVNILLEPINGRDMPGYFLNCFDWAAALIERIAAPNLRLQFDIYHRQILHGDVIMGLRKHIALIDHVQTASVPGRNEPGTGELNDDAIFAELDALGYDGFVGCEYRAAARTQDGLGWFAPYKRKA
jgi:hydroxypyruvate isomerase